MAFRVRDAAPEDCEEIMSLVKEMAEYEKLAHQVTLTAQELRRDGFGPRPYYRCCVAQSEAGALIGYGLCFLTYSTFQGRSLYLEDVYVRPARRGQGVGAALWGACVQVGRDEGCERMQFIVLDWNERARTWYKSMGCEDLTEQEGWRLYRLRLRPEAGQAGQAGQTGQAGQATETGGIRQSRPDL